MFTFTSRISGKKVFDTKKLVRETAPDNSLVKKENIDILKALPLQEAFCFLLNSLKNVTSPYWARFLIKLYIRKVLDEHPWSSSSTLPPLKPSEYDDSNFNEKKIRVRYLTPVTVREYAPQIQNDIISIFESNKNKIQEEKFILGSDCENNIDKVKEEKFILSSESENNKNKITEEKVNLGSKESVNSILSIFRHELATIPHVLKDTRLRENKFSKMSVVAPEVKLSTESHFIIKSSNESLHNDENAAINLAAMIEEEKKFELEPTLIKKQKRHYEPLTQDFVSLLIDPSDKSLESQNLSLASLLIPGINRMNEYILNLNFLCKDVNFIVFEYYQESLIDSFIDSFNRVQQIISSFTIFKKNILFPLLLQYPELIKYSALKFYRVKNIFDLALEKLDENQMNHILQLQEKNTLNFLLDIAIGKRNPELIKLILQNMDFPALINKNNIIINEPSEEYKKFIMEKIVLLDENVVNYLVTVKNCSDTFFPKRDIMDATIKAHNLSFYYLSNAHIISQCSNWTDNLLSLSNNVATNIKNPHMSFGLSFMQRDYLYLRDGHICSILEIILKIIERENQKDWYKFYKIFDEILSFYSSPLALKICSRIFSHSQVFSGSLFEKAVLALLQDKTSFEEKHNTALFTLQCSTAESINQIIIKEEKIKSQKRKEEYMKGIEKYSELKWDIKPISEQKITLFSSQNKPLLVNLQKKFNDSVKDYKGSAKRKNAIKRIRLNFLNVIIDPVISDEDSLILMLNVLNKEYSIAHEDHLNQFFKVKKQSELEKKILLILKEYSDQPAVKEWTLRCNR
ncbi:MAG: hypothetical protein JO131_07600 [Gammaproteobacteria bacterium]|nr:hypothetical protein [Gammaproteobacteria bacterium]